MKKGIRNRLLLFGVLLFCAVAGSFLWASAHGARVDDPSVCQSRGAGTQGNQMLWDVLSQHIIPAVSL